MQNQQKRIPTIPKPNNHENINGSPGHFQNFPVLMIRAVIERGAREIKIKINIRAYLSIDSCCDNSIVFVQHNR